MTTKATSNENFKSYGKLSGPIVMIGFGSIGRGCLPLLLRHFQFDVSQLIVIDPIDHDKPLLDQHGIRFLKAAITKENYKQILTPLLKSENGDGFCVNLSVDVSSLAIMQLCRELKAFYIDTVVEPWAGFYFDDSMKAAARSNYALRETILEEKRMNPKGRTAVS